MKGRPRAGKRIYVVCPKCGWKNTRGVLFAFKRSCPKCNASVVRHNELPRLPENFSWPGEEWKDVVGYEGLYSISNHGRVRSLKRNRLIKHIKSNGMPYYRLALCKNNSAKLHQVHRLVALHFVDGNCPEKNYTNHKDGNKTNNHFSNLEWVSPLENSRHAYRCGLRGKWRRIQRLPDGKIYDFAPDAAREINVHVATVNRVLNGKKPHVMGYKFKYVEAV